MNILGVNCYGHDASATLLVDGVPVCAVEEERFIRQKHTGVFPENAIRCCLEMGFELGQGSYYGRPLPSPDLPTPTIGRMRPLF